MTTIDVTGAGMTWRAICSADRLPVERAVAALLPEGQVAIVRTADGTLYAVGHRDPYSGANVIARGIIGSTSVDGRAVPTIASPMYKQVFALTDGRCLSDPAVSLGSWAVRDRDGSIEVGRCLVAATERRDA